MIAHSSVLVVNRSLLHRAVTGTQDVLPAPGQTELVRNRGPWKAIDDLEIAAAEYIDWFNFRRLFGEIGLVPPVEYETTYRSTTLPEQPAQRELEASIKPGS